MVQFIGQIWGIEKLVNIDNMNLSGSSGLVRHFSH